MAQLVLWVQEDQPVQVRLESLVNHLPLELPLLQLYLEDPARLNHPFPLWDQEVLVSHQYQVNQANPVDQVPRPFLEDQMRQKQMLCLLQKDLEARGDLEDLVGQEVP